MLNVDPKVKYARLQRKYDRVLNQLGVAKKLNEHYKAVFDLSPYIMDRHEKYEEKKWERVRVQGLEDRCKEQAALILLLQKQINKE